MEDRLRVATLCDAKTMEGILTSKRPVPEDTGNQGNKQRLEDENGWCVFVTG